MKNLTKAQLQQKLRDNLAEIKSLREKADAKTAEEYDRLEALLNESKEAQTELERKIKAEEEAKAAEASLNSFLTEPTNRFSHTSDGGDGSHSGIKKFAVPASARRIQVKNFKSDPVGTIGGMSAHEKAYGFGMFLLATIGGNAKAQMWCAEHGINTKAQAENSNTAGGFLVPPEFDGDIIDLRESFGVFRAFAKRSTMTSDTKNVPRRTGGVTAYFTTDNVAVQDSTKNWGQVSLTAKKLMALVLYSSELNEDSIIELGDDLAREIAYAFAQKEDACGFIGDGSAQYSGIIGVTNALLNLSATHAQIAGLVLGSGAAFGGLTLPNFTAMLGLLPQYADMRNRFVGPGSPTIISTDVRWFTHRSFYYNVMLTIALEAGGVTEKEVLESYTKPMFLGYPVEFAQILPSQSASGIVPCLFGNLALAALFGDRRETTIAMSDQWQFGNDQLAIKGTERFDINVHDVGNANATANLRVPGPMIGLLTS